MKEQLINKMNSAFEKIQKYPSKTVQIFHHNDTDGLLVLAMNLADSPDNIHKIVQDYSFLNSYNSSDFFLEGFKYIPLNVVIDKDGIIQFIGVNQLPTDEELEGFLNEI